MLKEKRKLRIRGKAISEGRCEMLGTGGVTSPCVGDGSEHAGFDFEEACVRDAVVEVTQAAAWVEGKKEEGGEVLDEPRGR